ncbi:hypothetical protein AMTR_s03753p00007200 [Amborella trichopoda]|uniref:Uncharacterized protein n=1 Tax=Amborella trichopoda TaxID=13333 RepID=U5CY36_AMBTC|nr:hypothetical protein AMTR_s03753p00007200 [Amborella trichopoda]
MGGSMIYTDPNSNSSQFPIPGRLSIHARTLNSHQEIGHTTRIVRSGLIQRASISAVSHPLLLRHLDWPEKSPVARFLTDFGEKFRQDLARRREVHSGRCHQAEGRRSNLGNGNGKGDGVVLIMDEAGQELRVLNNRLLQWRFLNAKAQFLAEKKATFAQETFLFPFQREMDRI